MDELMETAWYVVDLLFAQLPEEGSTTVLCESSQVLFQAPTAEAAYDRGVEWARGHEQEAPFAFVGVRHVYSLDDPPGDGCEVGGHFFEEMGVWEQPDRFIPAREEIPIIQLESRPDEPVESLMSDETKAKMRKIFP
jgi:hypothetical protein